MKHPNPRTIEDVQARVRETAAVIPCGGRTKPALLAPDGAACVDMTGLRDVVDYEPSEFTITVQAGLPLADLARLLGSNGQYLPFDPPLVEAGATIGGTVAAGLSGPGALGGGGLRDFVIGVGYIDGAGRLIRGGGRVVKNAAGFDLPKLMVGSLGRLGVLVEVSLKVFPRPRHDSTVSIECGGLAEAVEMLHRIAGSNLQADALDLEPPGRLFVRLSGNREALPRRMERLVEICGLPAEPMVGAATEAYWKSVCEFAWAPPQCLLVKVPLTAGEIVRLDHALEPVGTPRRYSIAGNVAYLAWPGERGAEEVEQLLQAQDLCGLVLRGEAAGPQLNPRPGLGPRLKNAMDPAGRFAEL